MAKSANLQSLAEKWPSPYVARQEIKTFSGGLISDKYIANLDSQGAGPSGRIRCGRKVAYEVNSLVDWLQKRSVNLDE
jgi:hypothetical protein